MNTAHLTRTLICLSLVACDARSTASPDDAGPAEDANAESGPVPQEPDPPELAELREIYLRGDYPAVEQAADPLTARLTEPSQARAAGLVLAWHALAAAESIPENAKPKWEMSLAKAEETEDDEVGQLARIARGVYLMRLTEAANAQGVLDEAIALEGPHTVLASLFRAESLLNQAFDQNDLLVDKSKLDAARQAYEEVSSSTEEKIVMARAAEGMAAVAKEQRDLEELCQRAGEAAALYDEASASDFLRQGPGMLANDAGCEASQ